MKRSKALWSIFSAEYLTAGPVRLVRHDSSTVDGMVTVTASVTVDGVPRTITGRGNGPIAAFTAAAYLEVQIGERVLWGVAVDANIVTASLHAVLNAVARVARG